jgi:hypothetical protein
MTPLHVISEEAFHEARHQLSGTAHWVAYNVDQHLLEKADLHFFPSEDAARTFAKDLPQDSPWYRIIKADSIYALYDHFASLETLLAHPTISLQFKHTIMEENNYEYLAKQLKWTGFGEKPLEELKRHMQSGVPEIAIHQTMSYNEDKAVVQLNFKRSGDKDMYFFNSYHMKVENPVIDLSIDRKFYINTNQDNITVKEAYNLLMGRAIEKEITPKEGEKYKAWLQLDFKDTDTNGQYKTKQFHPNYGFDLEKVLYKHPFRELETPENKHSLLESLQRGNRQSVTLEADGKEIKLFIEAAPQFKSLNYYDGQMKRVNVQELTTATGAKQDIKKESVKQSAGASDEEGETDGKAKQKRSRKQSI